MRFSVELLLDNEKIPKDKNRMIISLLKHNYSSYDKDYYYELYEKHPNKMKSYTFALYMGRCQFLREDILIPEKRIILNFSTCDVKDGIMFYNSILKNKGIKYPINGNSLTINRIRLVKERPVIEDEVIFKTLSPISVREHKGDNKTTWYHSLNDEKGQEVFMNNLRYQILNYFGEERMLDVEEVEFQVLTNREVKVKHYGIEVLANICKLKIKAKPYILDFLYRAGIGSQRSSGFGMVDLV
jgi:CRISPR-associated endoribonuclease Cas6